MKEGVGEGGMGEGRETGGQQVGLGKALQTPVRTRPSVWMLLGRRAADGAWVGKASRDNGVAEAGPCHL